MKSISSNKMADFDLWFSDANSQRSHKRVHYTNYKYDYLVI